MKILVIGSCTGDKDVRDCPGLIKQSDVDDPVRRQRREAELSAWALPASVLYTGWQHRYMLTGVAALRRRFREASCSVKIISAGYGLVDEEQRLVPYEVTFQGARPKIIRARSTALGIPGAVRRAMIGYDLVLFLLGKEYLLSINPPLDPATSQRLVFLMSNTGLPFHPASVIVPAGRAEARFGAGTMTLKGKMFERFATGRCNAPKKWEKLLSDASATTVLELVEPERPGAAARHRVRIDVSWGQPLDSVRSAVTGRGVFLLVRKLERAPVPRASVGRAGVKVVVSIGDPSFQSSHWVLGAASGSKSVHDFYQTFNSGSDGRLGKGFPASFMAQYPRPGRGIFSLRQTFARPTSEILYLFATC